MSRLIFDGHDYLKMVRRPGIEPGPPAWKAGILTTELTTLLVDNWIKMVTGVGFEPTPPKRLVPKTSALDHSATQPDLCQSSGFYQQPWGISSIGRVRR